MEVYPTNAWERDHDELAWLGKRAMIELVIGELKSGIGIGNGVDANEPAFLTKLFACTVMPRRDVRDLRWRPNWIPRALRLVRS